MGVTRRWFRLQALMVSVTASIAFLAGALMAGIPVPLALVPAAVGFSAALFGTAVAYRIAEARRAAALCRVDGAITATGWVALAAAVTSTGFRPGTPVAPPHAVRIGQL